LNRELLIIDICANSNNFHSQSCRWINENQFPATNIKTKVEFSFIFILFWIQLSQLKTKMPQNTRKK